MKRVWIFLAVLALGIPLGAWWFSAEQVMKRRVKHLMEVLSLSEGSGGPLRQAKVFSMNGLIAGEVEISAPEIRDANGIFDKQEIEAAFSWICQNAKGSDFRVTDFTEVVVEGEEARTVSEVEGYLALPSYRPADGFFKVTIHWSRADGGWRLYKLIWENS